MLTYALSKNFCFFENFVLEQVQMCIYYSFAKILHTAPFGYMIIKCWLQTLHS